MDTQHELCETVREYGRESWLHARHNETQRSAVSGAVIAISAAVVGFITSHELNQNDLPLTLFLMFLGLFGAAFCAKHYERFSLHMEIIRESQVYLDRLLPGEPLEDIFAKAKAAHKRRGHWLRWARLNHFWVLLHLLIALLGLLLSIYINADLFDGVIAWANAMYAQVTGQQISL